MDRDAVRSSLPHLLRGRETCCRDKLPELLHDTVIRCDNLNHTDQHYISRGDPYQMEVSRNTERNSN